MPQPALRITLTDEERETLMAWSRSGASEHRKVERARVVLLASEGLSAERLPVGLEPGWRGFSKWRRAIRPKSLSWAGGRCTIRKTEDVR